MEKKLAIYIKEFDNEDEQKYIYGEELDRQLSRLTEMSKWVSVKIYKDKIEKSSDPTTLKAYHQMIKKALKKEIDVIATFFPYIYSPASNSTILWSSSTH